MIDAEPVGEEFEGEARGSVKGGNRVSIGVEHDAATVGDAHGACRTCVGWQRRQRFQMGFFFGKEIDGPLLCFAMDAEVGDLIHPVARGGVERAQRAGKFQAGQEVLFHVGDGVLHAAFFVSFSHVAGAGLEAVVSGEVQVARMEEGFFAQRMRKHAGFQVVDDNGAGGSAQELERVLVAAKKVFERFAERELDIDHAAVAKHHDEKGEPPARGSYLKGAGAAPVHLRAFPGSESQGKKGGLAHGTHQANVILQDAQAALIALLGLQALEDLGRAVGVALQPALDGGLEWV